MTTRSPHRHRLTRRWLPLALGSLLAFVLTGSALATHERPAGGTPFRVPLVPAYAACTTAPITHASGLPGCPANDESFGGKIGTSGVGSVRLDVFCTDASIVPCPAPGDQEDVRVTVSQTDVQCEVDIGAGPCPGGASGDYAGPVTLNLPFRLTDHAGTGYCANGAGTGCTNTTVYDGRSFNIPFACTPVGPVTPPGSTCSVATTLDAIATPDMVVELQRSVWDQVYGLTLFDPGLDGDPGPPGLCPPSCHTGDESPLMRAGWFTP